MNDYQHIKPWTIPRNYCGEVWPAYYSAGVGQSRDSDALERANFDAMLAALGGETETVQVVRESHWAVGWVEWIAIHQDDTTACQTADMILGKLNDYPIIDEDRFSQYEDDDCSAVWTGCYGPTERAAYLRQHVRKVYPFPDMTAYQMLRRAVQGEWSYAANLLPCPADLLS
jgi:hypothetical protein